MNTLRFQALRFQNPPAFGVTQQQNAAINCELSVQALAAKKGQSTQEDRSKGSVSSAVYLTYLRAWGPGLMLPVLYISIALFDRTVNVRSLVSPC
jgi:hypothetical protein